MEKELEPNYKPSSEEEYMNENQLQYFKEKLLKLKSSLKEDCDTGGKMFFLGGVEHRYKQELELALENIDKKEYGTCVVHREPLGLKRLEEKPYKICCEKAQKDNDEFEREHVVKYV